MNIRAAITAAAVLVAAPAAAQAPAAPATPRQAVDNYLAQGDRASPNLTAHATHYGELAKTKRQRVKVDARPGFYRVIGSCDLACKNVDLYLYDDLGDEQEKDTLGDKFPIMEFNVTKPGPFEVEVEIAECETATCAWGVRIYRR